MSLDDIRREIDQLDDQIIALLARRQQQVIRAAGYEGSPATAAPERRAQLMRRLRAQASTSEVDPEILTEVYTAMIDAFIELEHRAIAETSSVSSASTGWRHRVKIGRAHV